MRFEIRIKIDYDSATVISPDDVREKLERALRRHIQHGILDDGREIVDQYSAEVIYCPE